MDGHIFFVCFFIYTEPIMQCVKAQFLLKTFLLSKRRLFFKFDTLCLRGSGITIKFCGNIMLTFAKMHFSGNTEVLGV